jgi:hypothetical protein
MKQRILGTLLWCVLLPVAGLGWLGAASLRFVVSRVERVFVLGGLIAALSMPNPLMAQLSQARQTPEGEIAGAWVLAFIGIVLLGQGVRATWLRRLRRVLRRRGWSF